jgi:hypothetical protein
VLLVPLVGFGRTYDGVGTFAKWTQTLAVLEILHAATGKHWSTGPALPTAGLHLALAYGCESQVL